ncbi:MAG: hypothetical protein WCH99_01670 [Verrucomicrobiota bacterium]
MGVAEMSLGVCHQLQRINMTDKIIIKPKSETNPAPVQENQSINLNRAQLVNLCAIGLGVSFFLPWAHFFGTTPSGFDLQKLGDEQRFLWLIPICCAIIVFAGVTKRSQKIIGQFTGALPFIVGIYWYSKFKNDLFHILGYGTILSLIFGAALSILTRKTK